jgi:polysaccharide export outer membrane protein
MVSTEMMRACKGPPTAPAKVTRPFAALLGIAVLMLSAPAWGQSREALGEGDTVHITVFQNPDLTTETRISERGTITFPLIGEVAIAKLTPAGAEARIAEQLRVGKFLLKPQVSLNVVRVRSRQVSVLGQVARPGRYALDDTSSNLTDILALAGGISPTGDDNITVMVTRNGKTAKLDINVARMYRTGDLSQNIQVEGGDTIFVQRAPVFYIYGEVQRAGSYRLEPTMTVMQALSLGGGVTPRGTDRGLKIHRRVPNGAVQKLDAQLTDPVEPDDVIYVKESLF